MLEDQEWVHCPTPIMYVPQYFWTKYPSEKTKLWNLKNLLNPSSWLAYLITIISVLASLKLCCYVGKKLGLDTVTEEIALVPFG